MVVEFLGMSLGETGIKIDLKKEEILKIWQRMDLVTAVRNFLSLLQLILYVHSKVLSTCSTGDEPHIEGKWCVQVGWVFHCGAGNQKKIIIEAIGLVTPNWSEPFRVTLNPYKKAFGGTLIYLMSMVGIKLSRFLREVGWLWHGWHHKWQLPSR